MEILIPNSAQHIGRQCRPPGKENMEEFDYEGYREQLQRAAGSEEF